MVMNGCIQNGSSSHSKKSRIELDYYATDPTAVEKFLKTAKENDIKIDNKLWECATGENHIKNVLKKNNYDIVGTDIIKRRVDIDGLYDFLSLNHNPYPERSIITNPPYSSALGFLEKALELVENKKQVIFMLKIQFLESKSRYEFFKKYPPKYVFVHSSRVLCGRNGDFSDKVSAVCYAWYFFEKGFKGNPQIYWIE